MLKREDIKVGARVRCLKEGRWFGIIGTIKAVHPEGKPYRFDVYQDNGSVLGVIPTWTILEYFELVKSASTTIVSKECPCGIFRGDCDYHK